MKKAFLVSPNPTITKWLKTHFGIETISNLSNADVVVFPGGLDVDPNLYKEPVGQRTSFDPATDASWVSNYKEAVKQNKKVLGICKGSQFLTVMAGGTLYQHVSGHATINRHNIVVGDGKVYDVTSTHHQMMNPYNMDTEDFEILACAESPLSSMYLNGYDEDEPAPAQELEAVLYKGNGALAIQFHPEFMEKEHDIHKVIEDWILRMFSYTPSTFFDRYQKKRKSGGKSTEKFDSVTDLGEVSVELFEEFIQHYL